MKIIYEPGDQVVAMSSMPFEQHELIEFVDIMTSSLTLFEKSAKHEGYWEVRDRDGNQGLLHEDYMIPYKFYLELI